tara:strand:- start:298 stop:468 length:171 start_codon:yes stop_codon:yes gene_type:complete
MESIKLVFAGFFMGFAISCILASVARAPSVTHIDKEKLQDKEIEAVILLEIPETNE